MFCERSIRERSLYIYNTVIQAKLRSFLSLKGRISSWDPWEGETRWLTSRSCGWRRNIKGAHTGADTNWIAKSSGRLTRWILLTPRRVIDNLFFFFLSYYFPCRCSLSLLSPWNLFVNSLQFTLSLQKIIRFFLLNVQKALLRHRRKLFHILSFDLSNDAFCSTETRWNYIARSSSAIDIELATWFYYYLYRELINDRYSITISMHYSLATNC